MGLYTGFDLHSTNTYVGIIDEDGKRIASERSGSYLGNADAIQRGYPGDCCGVHL